MLIVGHNNKSIENLKKDLIKPFATKDIGFTRKILDMRCARVKKNDKLWLFNGGTLIRC